MRIRILGLTIALVASSLTVLALPTQAATLSLINAEDHEGDYSRSAFRHWIDADKDGCDTRAEVLIEEAIVKPKVGNKCALIGGKWRSQYDKLVTTNASALDIDHLVPLAEAWRSGAWAWTDKQREDFANDLTDSRALVAVSASSNRSKGDKDYSQWRPKLNDGTEAWIGCNYLKAWIAIKMRYQLTVDSNEASWIQTGNTTCAFGNSIKVLPLSGLLATASPQSSPPAAPVNLGKQMGVDMSSLMSGLNTVGKWKVEKISFFPNHKGQLEFVVEDPPVGILTEDLNDRCVTISVSTESGSTFYENSTITVSVRCRWVNAESVAGSGWKWRSGSSTKPLDPAICGKLVEVLIDGIKALACAPADSAPNANASPTPTSSGSKQCWVNGYTTKKGTTVKGYYRSC
jgi:hypothetical protein